MIFAFCHHCGEKTEYLNIKEATAVAHIGRGTIYEWIERGRLHLAENLSGHKFVCKQSLLRPLAQGFSASARG